VNFTTTRMMKGVHTPIASATGEGSEATEAKESGIGIANVQ